jgi:hypothetical protein
MAKSIIPTSKKGTYDRVAQLQHLKNKVEFSRHAINGIEGIRNTLEALLDMMEMDARKEVEDAKD